MHAEPYIHFSPFREYKRWHVFMRMNFTDFKAGTLRQQFQ